jgi:hypothetical protein
MRTLGLILDHFWTRRPVALRVGTGVSAMLFLGTSGFGGFELHPSSQHPLHSGDIVAMQLGVAHDGAHRSEASGAERPDSAEHRSSHPHHDSSDECTCVGVCQGGASPSLDHPASLVSDAPSENIRVVQLPIPLIRDDPTSYLVPLPNAPPLRA